MNMILTPIAEVCRLPAQLFAGLLTGDRQPRVRRKAPGAPCCTYTRNDVVGEFMACSFPENSDIAFLNTEAMGNAAQRTRLSWFFKSEARTYLVRVFVNILKKPNLVITVYRTSKVDKYGKDEG